MPVKIISNYLCQSLQERCNKELALNQSIYQFIFPLIALVLTIFIFLSDFNTIKEQASFFLYFLLKNGKSPATTVEQMDVVHGENKMSVKAVQKRFIRLRPVAFDLKSLQELVNAESPLSLCMMGERMNSLRGNVYPKPVGPTQNCQAR